MDKLIAGVLGVILGGIISRILTHIEVEHLKHQLFNAEEENDKLIAENKGLKEHNGMLYDKLTKIKQQIPGNLPDFDEW